MNELGFPSLRGLKSVYILLPPQIATSILISSSKRNLDASATDVLKKEALATMEHPPSYLKEISLRNSFAESLEGIAMVFVQHARSVMDCLDYVMLNASYQLLQSSTFSLRDLSYGRASGLEIFCSTSPSNIASIIPTTLQLGAIDFDTQLNDDMATFIDRFDCGRLFGFAGIFNPGQQDQLPTSE